MHDESFLARVSDMLLIILSPTFSSVCIITYYLLVSSVSYTDN